MADAAAQEISQTTGPEETPHARAKHLILKVLGVRRVANWCGVEVSAVWQWLQRGTDAEPIPPKRVPAIVAGARSEGLDAPVEILWPAMAGAAE